MGGGGSGVATGRPVSGSSTGALAAAVAISAGAAASAVTCRGGVVTLSGGAAAAAARTLALLSSLLREPLNRANHPRAVSLRLKLGQPPPLYFLEYFFLKFPFLVLVLFLRGIIIYVYIFFLRKRDIIN
jgi:hypothetical protein